MSSQRLDQCEAERQNLISLAYRMLGERAAAEDVVQEAWIRWSKSGGDQIECPGAWLHRVTSRIAIDVLRSAKQRRETYVGPWLPEALFAGETNSGIDDFELAQECELALLWAMERLTPEERAAFILRQAFDAEYTELAAVLSRTEAACRQLVSRARQKVKSARPKYDPDPQETAEMLAQFAQATVAQDHATVLSLLAPDVTAISDGGGKVRAAFRPLVGDSEVAQVFLSIVAKQAQTTLPRLVRANGLPALAILDGSQSDMVFTVTVNDDGLIDWIYLLRNPEKLASIAMSQKLGD
jgi:RNA polymerase sigma-70 factor (ECF subfamily)